MSIEAIKVLYDINNITLDIRDPYGKSVLKATIGFKYDVLITGDKDFLESNIKFPKNLMAKNFIENY